ncbi:MAG: lysophospholipid acyltransferase family protein [Bacteroidales bacterium]|nr:lysophospholipid acyltransferase family protein [Bacteroidales bacterium]MCF8454742.1 lysophospholipid acyltransferase family protein [Bacteroidales bacterium]
MNLVNPEDIVAVSKINGFGGEIIARLLMQVLKLNKINRVYDALYQKNGVDFLNALIDQLELKYEISADELNRIPKKGPFITISNHPFGGIDGILLMKLICEVRPDYKLMANYLLQKLDPLQNLVFPDNPFETKIGNKSGYSGLKLALNHLNEGYPMGIFPASDVSTHQNDSLQVSDKQWQNSALKFIKHAKIPVVPIYFQGSNSRLFHVLGRIHPLLSSAKLPSELLNKKKKIIHIRIGNPIPVKDQDEFNELSRYGRFLRAKTYALGTPLEVKKFFRRSQKRSKKQEELIPSVPLEKIMIEIEKIGGDYFLFQSKNYKVFCAPSFEIPNILIEVGRLRELTFRKVGEGTNRSSDLDEFDLYYHQLVIWDDEAKKIVGAYRVGKGKDIFANYGIRGFYIQTLFRISKPLYPLLNESIELGRSFIVEEYQRKPLSLFLLWKGILYFLLKHPEYRYLIGPVSISNEFSKFSKGLLVEFVMKNFYNYELAKYITPRKEFVVEEEINVDKEIFLENANDDINRLDKVIQDIEPKYSMPVLLKKYIKLNAKIIGFNIDPKFNDALDGLLILDLFDVPISVIESLSKEINDDSILERFNLQEHDSTGRFKGK